MRNSLIFCSGVFLAVCFVVDAAIADMGENSIKLSVIKSDDNYSIFLSNNSEKEVCVNVPNLGFNLYVETLHKNKFEAGTAKYHGNVLSLRNKFLWPYEIIGIEINSHTVRAIGYEIKEGSTLRFVYRSLSGYKPDNGCEAIALELMSDNITFESIRNAEE